MARLQKIDKPKLAKAVSFRLSDADYATFTKKVAASGMKESMFLRDCVLTNKTTVIAKPKASLEKGRMVFLVNKISNNMNQLAHRLNTDHLAGKVSENGYENILYELQSINTYLSKILSHVD